MRQELSKDAQMIYDLICTVGSVSTPQIERILGKGYESADKIVKTLCAKRYTKWIDNMYSIPFSQSNVKQDDISCLWVMLDLISFEDGRIDLDDLGLVIEGNGIVNFSYIQDGNNVVNLVYVDKNSISKVAATVQRFYTYNNIEKGSEKDAHIAHIFVTSSNLVVKEIKDMQLSIPHKIALLSEAVASSPEIEYL